MCVCNLLVCERSTLPDYAEKTHLPTAMTRLQPGSELRTQAPGSTSGHTLGNGVFVMSQRATTPQPDQAGLFHLEFRRIHGDAEGLSSVIIFRCLHFGEFCDVTKGTSSSPRDTCKKKQCLNASTV